MQLEYNLITGEIIETPDEVPPSTNNEDKIREIKSKINSLESERMLPREVRYALIEFLENKYSSEELKENFEYNKILKLESSISVLRKQLQELLPT